MQITADVNIPDSLVQAARTGRLVLFIGAGVSLNKPSSLPLFNGLAAQIADELGQSYVDSGNPDAFLGDLEERFPEIREHVRAIISRQTSLPNDTHRAVARLSNATGARIVSTNYDEHIEAAASEEGIDLGRRYYAPALPLGHDFDGVVYLHGAVSEAAKTLVVTDGDFGRAYLIDGWARRFAHELFMKWTVLFIGYSHNDVVMTYLARGLPVNANRYVLTSEPKDKRWRPLGITPISYPKKKKHRALTQVLDAWAGLAKMGQLEHYARVRDIAMGAPPKTPEEIDYLADAITTLAGAQAFASEARGYDWLRWAEEQQVFRNLFRAGRNLDAVSALMSSWFVNNFVLPPDAASLGLGAIARLGPVVSEDMRWEIMRVQKSLHAADASEAVRWDAVLTATIRTTAGGLDSGWYQPFSYPFSGAKLLPMLRRALVPRLILSEQRGWSLAAMLADTNEDAEPAGVSAEIQWSIGEGLLRMLWESLSTELDLVANDALQIAEQGLRDAYRLTDAFEPERRLDEWSFRRGAIEPHPQDDSRADEDTIIDLLRDCGLVIARRDPSLAGRWLESEYAIFRRLGLYLVTELQADSPHSLQAVLTKGTLFDFESKHEVFRLLATLAPSMDSADRERLLEAVKEGPSAQERDGSDLGTRLRNRSIFDRLEWLHRYSSEWPELDDALEHLRTIEPNMAPRQHPDYEGWTEFGVWGGKPPVSSGELSEIVRARGAWYAVGVLTRADYSERDPDKPTWDDAVQLVRETVAADPKLGIKIYPLLLVTPFARYEDLRAACIFGWSDAHASSEDFHDLLELVEADQHQRGIVRAACELLLETIKKPEDLGEDLLTRLDSLAVQIWSNHSAAFIDSGWSDPMMRGLNTWPGIVAQYWVQRVSERWQATRDVFAGLDDTQKSALRAILDDSSAPSARASAIPMLAADFAFLFAADPSFAKEHLLPLFDPVSSNIAGEAWRTFLHRPRTSPEMLDSGFWEMLLSARDTLESAGDNAIIAQYWKVVASIAAYSTAAAIDREVLIALLARTPGASGLISFLNALADVLQRDDSSGVQVIWDSWLGSAMATRLGASPGVVSVPELSAWNDLALDLALLPAIEISRRGLGPLTDNSRFSRIPRSMQTEHATLILRIARDRLALTANVGWRTHHELRTLVEAIGGAADVGALRMLVEEALAHGLGDAIHWIAESNSEGDES